MAMDHAIYMHMMATRHGSKRSAQTSNSPINQHIKAAHENTKINKETTKEDKQNEERKDSNVEDMFKTIMTKLQKLDTIEEHVKDMEQELKEVKKSLEYAYNEMNDLRDQNVELQKSNDELKERLDVLEERNSMLNNRVIDIQARSMRDNLLFHNIAEKDNEDTDEIIYNLVEQNLQIPHSRNIKIDRSHRIGKIRIGASKPRPIVAKFNFYPDKERILTNANKLKGTRIGISEQFPEEIVKERKRLFPIMKKARDDGRRVKLTRDKLYIDGQLYRA